MGSMLALLGEALAAERLVLPLQAHLEEAEKKEKNFFLWIVETKTKRHQRLFVYLSPHIKKEHKIKIYGHCHKEEKKKYLQWTFSMNRRRNMKRIAQYFCKYQTTTTRKLYILAYFFVREDPLKKKIKILFM
jgi:hypothetical protein